MSHRNSDRHKSDERHVDRAVHKANDEAVVVTILQDDL